MTTLLQVSVLMLCVATAFALKCYTCTGTEGTCSKSKLEGNNDKYLKTCPSGLDRCFRTWVHKDGNTAVTNDCTNQSGCDLAQNVCDKVDDVDCTVGCCGSDACNAGTTEKGPGLKCFVCSGNEDDCKKSTLEGDKDKYLKTCNLGEDKCMRAWGNKDGEITVTSSCASQHDCSL
ncbi:hypothetical protein ACROYT_G007757 [Oculina patagonica]